MTAIGAAIIVLTACGGKGGTGKSSSVSSASGSAVSSKVESATGAAIEFNPSDYVEKLGEYKGLEYTKADTAVTDEEVEDRVKSFLSNYPEKITDREIKEGDTVNIDYVGKKDGVAFEGGTDKGFNLTIGSGRFIPGFEEGLIGKKPGETVDLDLKFPDDYHSEELKGAKVVFTVTINHIEEAPKELTDELVKANTEFKTAEEYRNDARKKITESKISESDAATQRELLDKVVTTSAIKSVPQEVKDQYYEQIKNYWTNVAAQYGSELKDFITNQFKITEEEFENEIKSQAELSAKNLVVVRAIAEAEKLQVSDDEYKAGLETYYENSGAKGSMELDAFESEYGKGRIMDLILANKVGKFLIENGKEIEAAK